MTQARQSVTGVGFVSRFWPNVYQLVPFCDHWFALSKLPTHRLRVSLNLGPFGHHLDGDSCPPAIVVRWFPFTFGEPAHRTWIKKLERSGSGAREGPVVHAGSACVFLRAPFSGDA